MVDDEWFLKKIIPIPSIHIYIYTHAYIYYAFESSRVRGVIGKINDTMNNVIFFSFFFISRHIYSSVLRNLSKSFDPVRDKLMEN